MQNLKPVYPRPLKLLMALMLAPFLQIELETSNALASDDSEFIVLVKEWREVLNASTGLEMKGVAAAFAAANWEPWYKDGKVDLPSVRQNVNRCKQINKDVVQAWTAALKRQSGDEPGAIDLVLWLSRQDRLFKNEKWSKVESSNFLARMEAIPDDARSTWTEATKARLPGFFAGLKSGRPFGA
jgi:hypothetical protein